MYTAVYDLVVFFIVVVVFGNIAALNNWFLESEFINKFKFRKKLN